MINIENNPGTTTKFLPKGWSILKKMTMTVQGSGEVIIQMAGYDWFYIFWDNNVCSPYEKLSDNFKDYSHTYSEDIAHTITIIGENITHLYCGNNRITTLDVSKNPTLTELGCYENQITHLDVSKNTELTKLECWSNYLTSLDISANNALKELNFSNNPIKSMNFGYNTALTVIR